MILKYATHGISVYNDSDADIAPPILNCRLQDNVYGAYLYVGRAGNVSSLISGTQFFSNTYGLGTDTIETATGSSLPTLTNNTFRYNVGFPIYLGGTAYPVYNGNSFSNNVHRAIGLGGYFNASGTWSLVPGDTNPPFNGKLFPYVITESVTIAEPVVVTVPPSTLFKFNEQRYMDVFGVLDLQSSPVTTITFTSWNDDYYDDTNANLTGTLPARGDWDAIYLESNGTVFHNAVVKYADKGLSVYNASDGELAPPILDSRMEENTYGIYLFNENGWDITSLISGTTLISNTYGLVAEKYVDLAHNYIAYGVARPILMNDQFTHHSEFPIYLAGTAEPIYSRKHFCQ